MKETNIFFESISAIILTSYEIKYYSFDLVRVPFYSSPGTVKLRNINPSYLVEQAISLVFEVF